MLQKGTMVGFKEILLDGTRPLKLARLQPVADAGLVGAGRGRLHFPMSIASGWPVLEQGYTCDAHIHTYHITHIPAMFLLLRRAR